MLISGRRLLCILPSDGHGGCEYNALTFLVYLRERHGFRVAVSFPQRASTAFLDELCAQNAIPIVPFPHDFARNDDRRRAAEHRAATRAILDRVQPDLCFVPLAWPERGQGVIAGCADRGVPTLVKFALVPEMTGTPFVMPEARAALGRNQIWFANSRPSAALVERRFALRTRSVDSFQVGPIGLARLTGQQDPGPRDACRAALRASLDLEPEAKIAVCVARLAEQKGLRTLLGAADSVLAARHDLTILLVGEGEMRPEIEAWRRARAHGRRLVLAGFRPDVRAILRGADLFAFPTLYEGGCSQALLEALEEGLPVVASAVSAIGEIVTNRVSGLLVPPSDAAALADAVETVLDDPALALRLAAAGRRAAAPYSAERSFDETLRRLRALDAWYGLVPAIELAPPAIQALSRVSHLAIRPDEGAFGPGWHPPERGPCGSGFRWLGHAGTVMPGIVLDAPAVVEVSGYSSLTDEALATLALTVDGRPAVPIAGGPQDERNGFRCRWRIDGAAGAQLPVLGFASLGARRPRDLSPSNGDARWLSVAVREISIEAAS